MFHEYFNRDDSIMMKKYHHIFQQVQDTLYNQVEFIETSCQGNAICQENDADISKSKPITIRIYNYNKSSVILNNTSPVYSVVFNTQSNYVEFMINFTNKFNEEQLIDSLTQFIKTYLTKQYIVLNNATTVIQLFDQLRYTQFHYLFVTTLNTAPTQFAYSMTMQYREFVFILLTDFEKMYDELVQQDFQLIDYFVQKQSNIVYYFYNGDITSIETFEDQKMTKEKIQEWIQSLE